LATVRKSLLQLKEPIQHFRRLAFTDKGFGAYASAHLRLSKDDPSVDLILV
jgi:hypothetical protein